MLYQLIYIPTKKTLPFAFFLSSLCSFYKGIVPLSVREGHRAWQKSMKCFKKMKLGYCKLTHWKKCHGNMEETSETAIQSLTHAHMYTHTHTHTHTQMHNHTCAHTHTCTPTHVNIHAHTNTWNLSFFHSLKGLITQSTIIIQQRGWKRLLLEPRFDPINPLCWVQFLNPLALPPAVFTLWSGTSRGSLRPTARAVREAQQRAVLAWWYPPGTENTTKTSKLLSKSFPSRLTLNRCKKNKRDC